MLILYNIFSFIANTLMFDSVCNGVFGTQVTQRQGGFLKNIFISCIMTSFICVWDYRGTSNDIKIIREFKSISLFFLIS